MIKEFNNLNDFEKAFPSEASCIEHFRDLRWPHGVACTWCGSMENIYELKKVGQYKCGDCRKKFGVRYDTIFADTKLPLRTWFKAIFLITSHKKGIASHQLAKDLGIKQKSAWHVLHRIREASMTEEYKRPLLSGTIQADETLVGGLEKNKHAKDRKHSASGYGSMKSKIMVFGMIQTDGDLRLQKIIATSDTKRIIRKNVRFRSTVHTDDAPHHRWMHREFEHGLVKHRLGEYVTKDGVTTNRIEGVFGHFKRSVNGVYHHLSDQHVDRYLGMFAWRWNRRDMEEGERVNALLQSVQGHKLTYKVLTRKDKAQ